MPPYFSFKCNNCGCEVVTSGPHEFYRDRLGRMKPCGHPFPSEEALKWGIAGLFLDLYCTECGGVSSIVMEEYDKRIMGWSPFRHLIHAEAMNNAEDPETKPCPSCGGEGTLVFLPDCSTSEGRLEEGITSLGPCRRCWNGQILFEEKLRS